MLTVGSLFSGVGGIDLGFENAGMEILWQVEYEEQAKQVLRHRWPNTKLYSDVRDVGAADGDGRTNLDPVDIICGGFPCQDLSVAGGRRGLDGERSGLFFEFARIIGEVRPSWIVIENVPGLLSSHKGEDFTLVIETLTQLGYGVGWRVLDSRYFGVPQRRRRVFIVGHIGNPRKAFDALFPVGTCLRGNTQKNNKGREENTGETGSGVASTIVNPGRQWNSMQGLPNLVEGPYWDGTEMSDTVDVSMLVKGQLMPEKRRMAVVLTRSEVAGPIDAHYWKGAGSRAGGEREFVATDWPPEIAPTLGAEYGNKLGLDQQHISSGGGGLFADQDVEDTINTSEDNSAGNRIQCNAKVSVTLQDGGGQATKTGIYSFSGSLPRRLTPLECERLQGFPDDWTKYGVKEDGTEIEMKDSPRYRFMGNAVTVNVATWIGKQIARVEAR